MLSKKTTLIVSEFLTKEALEKLRVKRIPDQTVVLSFKRTAGRAAITDGEMLSNEAIAHFNPTQNAGIGASYLFSFLSSQHIGLFTPRQYIFHRYSGELRIRAADNNIGTTCSTRTGV